MSLLKLLTCLTLGCFALTGCDNGAAKVQEEIKARLAKLQPVTAAEAEEFAKRFDKASADQDADAMSAAFAWEAIMDRSGRGIDFPPEAYAGFKKGFLKQVNGPQNGIVKELSQPGNRLSFLRLRSEGAEHYAVFRFSGVSGINYHEYLLAKDADNQVKVIDFYSFLSGELLTDTIKRLALQMVAGMDSDFFGRLDPKNSAWIKSGKDIQSMVDQIHNAEYEAALQIYDKLPPEIQKEKSAMLLRMQAAAPLKDEQRYAKAIAEYMQAFPSDKSLDLVTLDYFIINKQFAKANSGLDRLEKSVGGDPYLSTIRANIAVLSGEPAKAVKYMLDYVESRPDDLIAVSQAAEIAIQAADYPAALKFIQKFQSLSPDASWKELLEGPEYAAFRKSPEFRALLDSTAK